MSAAKQIRMTQHQYDMLFAAVAHLENEDRDADAGEEMFSAEIRALNRLLRQWRDSK